MRLILMKVHFLPNFRIPADNKALLKMQFFFKKNKTNR